MFRLCFNALYKVHPKNSFHCGQKYVPKIYDANRNPLKPQSIGNFQNVVGIHTSSRRSINPVFALLLKTKGIKVLKGVSIIFGRSFRKWHNKLPKEIQEQLSRHRISLGFVSITLVYILYYSYVHYDKSPITGRKRWISFTKEQILALTEINYQQLQSQFGSKLVDPQTELFQNCHKIVKTLVERNLDMDLVKDIDWRLNVIDDIDVNNAFVLPNGQIFVFTGMLKLLDSWEELAVIIGHEMSHALLGHVQVCQFQPLSCLLKFLPSVFKCQLTLHLTLNRLRHRYMDILTWCNCGFRIIT